jgi:hypothetical protein
MVVHLHKRLMKIYANKSNASEGSTAVMELRDKDQAAGLGLAKTFILCGIKAYSTYSTY